MGGAARRSAGDVGAELGGRLGWVTGDPAGEDTGMALEGLLEWLPAFGGGVPTTVDVSLLGDSDARLSISPISNPESLGNRA